MFLEPDDTETQQSNFYPSFPPFQNQPLGHSRPFFFNQPETAYSQRAQSPYNQHVAYESPRYSGYKDDSFSSSTSSDSLGLLGSGNFGVIRGGTFYNDNEGQTSSYTDDYNSYLHNGHGRPSFYFGGNKNNNNPRPYQHEQFANFRDFADINTPTDRQYSHYVIVYVNKNGTKQQVMESVRKPKNIIESLALLDETDETTTVSTTAEQVPEKKLSKSKRKLAKLLPEKKYNVKKSNKKILRDLHEPLLALS